MKEKKKACIVVIENIGSRQPTERTEATKKTSSDFITHILNASANGQQPKNLLEDVAVIEDYPVALHTKQNLLKDLRVIFINNFRTLNTMLETEQNFCSSNTIEIINEYIADISFLKTAAKNTTEKHLQTEVDELCFNTDKLIMFLNQLKEKIQYQIDTKKLAEKFAELDQAYTNYSQKLTAGSRIRKFGLSKHKTEENSAAISGSQANLEKMREIIAFSYVEEAADKIVSLEKEILCDLKLQSPILDQMKNLISMHDNFISNEAIALSAIPGHYEDLTKKFLSLRESHKILITNIEHQSNQDVEQLKNQMLALNRVFSNQEPILNCKKLKEVFLGNKNDIREKSNDLIVTVKNQLMGTYLHSFEEKEKKQKEIFDKSLADLKSKKSYVKLVKYAEKHKAKKQAIEEFLQNIDKTNKPDELIQLLLNPNSKTLTGCTSKLGFYKRIHKVESTTAGLIEDLSKDYKKIITAH